MKSFMLILQSFAFTFTLGFAQNQTYTPEVLQEDFQLFKEHILKVHPGLDTYTSLDTLKLAFEDIASKLNQPMTSIEFYRLLTPLHAMIGNGHTEFLPSADFLKAIGGDTPRFPFDVYWDNGALYILRNMSDHKNIQPGDQILSINDQSIASIMEYMIAQQTRDGINLTLPTTKVYQSFKSYYAFSYGIPKSFKLVLANKEGTWKGNVEGQTLKAIKATRELKYPNHKKGWPANGLPPVSLEIEKNIAIMTIRTMGLDFFKDNGMDCELFFKASFESIANQNITQLILDLRGNHGGDTDPGLILMSYLLNEKFDYYSNITTLVNKVPQPKYYAGVNGLINLLFKSQVRKYGTIYQSNELEETQNIVPLNPHFDGQIFVLTDGNSFSAAGELTGMLKNYTNAIFVGEEPGGSPIQNVSGVTLPMKLPNTGVRLMMPFVLWEGNVDLQNTGRGILPDYPIRNNIEEEINNVDAAMEFTIRLVNRLVHE